MKKLVAESIEEALSYKTSLNEGIGDIFKKAFSSLKKVGNLFLDFYQGKIVPLLPPINLGILFKNKQLPKAVAIIPSETDVQMVPSLESLRNKEAFIKRVEDREKEYARIRKAKGGLKNARPFDFSRIVSFDGDDTMNEARVPLEYVGTDPEDKVKNAGTRYITNQILLQIAKPKLRPPLIWGAPGIGKTSITKAVIESLGPGHRLIDVQTSIMAPDDWTLPAIVKSIEQGIKQGQMYTSESYEAKDIPKDWLPVYAISNDPEENARRNDKANDGEGGLIFLDELSRAPVEVQNTCLKLVNERQIGGKVLGSKWAIVAASNRETDDLFGQNDIGAALANRFQHINFVPTVDEWIEWGTGKGIDPRILTFVDFNRTHFYLFDNAAKTNTTPRSWEALSEMLAASQEFSHIVFTKADLETLVGMNVHSETCEAFIAFLVLIETFHPNEIKMLFTDPKKAPKPINNRSGKIDFPMATALIGAALSNTTSRRLTGKEVENWVEYWINVGNETLAATALYLLVEHHDYINAQIGEDPKKAEFKKAMDMFRATFGGIKFANMNRADIMGNIG